MVAPSERRTTRSAKAAARRRVRRGATIAAVALVGAGGAALWVGGVVVARSSTDSDLAADRRSTVAPSSTIAPTTTTAAPTTTTAAPTTLAPTTTTTAPPPPPPPMADGTLTRGESGQEIVMLQQRLLDLGYWLPGVDGEYGFGTSQAVMAFQKANALGRDGIAGPTTQAALADAARPTPRDAAGDHIEIDLERQLLLVVRGGSVQWAFNTSTGTEGWRTAPGDFTITRQIDGVRHAPLGELFRPKYFNGGIAIHGAGSIPGYPASHGCARVSNAAINMLWADGLAPIGTRVWVY